MFQQWLLLKQYSRIFKSVCRYLTRTTKSTSAQILLALLVSLLTQSVGADTVLRLLTHSAFEIDKALITRFEKQHNTQLVIFKAGDTGEALNKALLTQHAPIADVFFGVDHLLIDRALKASLFTPLPQELLSKAWPINEYAAAIDYGWVCFNYDIAWFNKQQLPPPKTLDELTQTAYKGLTAVLNPATSGPGANLMVATLLGMGTDKAWSWWKRMRSNQMKIYAGWNDAYYHGFTRNGGRYPIVLSYASSPAAEVYFADPKTGDFVTQNLCLENATYLQIEGVSVFQASPNKQLAYHFIKFLLSEQVQSQLTKTMWMWPVNAKTPAAELSIITPPQAPYPQIIPATQLTTWIKQWSDQILRGR